MIIRYRVGFKRETMSCPFMDRNKGYHPIVDSDAACVALFDQKDMAQKVCDLLNAEYLLNFLKVQDMEDI